MFCTNCGRQLNEGQRFCPNCGQQLFVAPAPVQQPVFVAPVQQPVAPAPVQQPVAPAPVEQPVIPTPVEQPVIPAPVEQPVYTAPVEQPAPAPVEQPVIPAPVEQPVAPAPVEPAYVPASQLPKQETYIPVSQQPKQETYIPVSQQPTAAPVAEQPVYPAPDAFQLPKQEPVAQPAPVFTVNAPVDEKPKKKKGKGGKIALIIIALLLVGAIVLAAFNWENIVRFVKRNTMEPTDYAVEVEKKAVADLAKSVGTAYDTAMQTADMSNVATKTQTTLQISDEVMTVLETLLAQEGMDLDLNWIDSITLDADARMDNGKMSADIGVGLNGSHLLTLSAAWDLETQLMWIGIPELNDAYLEFDMEEVLGEDLSDLYPTMMQMQAMYAQMAEVMPTGAELESMINKYAGIVLDHVKDVEKANETVKLDGLKQNLLVMTADFTPTDIMDVIIALLEEARDDEQVKNLLIGLAEIAGEDGDMIAEAYAEAMDELLADAEDAREEAPDGKFLTIETFLDSKDTIVGRTITLEMDGEEAAISYITITEGEKFAFEADFAGAAAIVGSGTIKDGKTNCEYTLEAMGEEYLTLKVENYSQNENGTVNGSFTLSPESAVLSAMDLDSDMLQMIGKNVALKLTVDNAAEVSAASFSILAGGVDLFTIQASGTTAKAGSVALPEVTVDVNDDAAGYAWLADLDLSAIVNNLENAGIPSEYMDAVKMVAEMFAAEFQ